MNLEQLTQRAIAIWRMSLEWLKRVDWRAWLAWRRLRWVLLVPAVLIAVLIALPFMIPVGVYKEKIVEQVRLATGRELKIDGDLQLSFWPAFGVRVDKVSLANVPGAAEAQMATMDRMIVGAELLPLLSGALKVTEVRFVKPVINLEVDANGRGNWVFETVGATAGSPASQGAPGEVSFADVRVDEGVLTYRDARSGMVQRVEGIDASVKLPGLDQPMTVDGALTWNKEEVDVAAKIGDLRALSSGGKSALLLKVGGAVMDASFDGTFDAASNRVSGNVDFAAESVKRLAAWVGVEAGDADKFGAVKISGAVNAGPTAVELTNAKLSAGELEATVSGTLDVTRTAFAGVVDARVASLRDLAKRAGASLPGSSGLGVATLRGPVSLSPGRVSLSKAAFSVDGDGLKGAFTGVFDVTRGTLAGTVEARSNSARDLAGRVGASLPEGRGFGPATLSGSISTAPGRVLFKDTKLSVDGELLRATFTGAVEAASGKIAGNVDLTSSSARELAARTGFQLPGAQGFGPLTVSGAVSGTPGRIAFNDAKLSIDGDVLRANFTGVFESAGSKVAGKIDLRSSSARRLAAHAGFVLPGDNGFGALAISGALHAQPNSVVFDDVRLSLDGMSGSGDVSLGNIQYRAGGARTFAKVALNLDRLDLNPYLGGGGRHTGGGSIPPWSESPIDLSALRAIDADLAFATDALNAGGLRIGRSVLDFALKGGTLTARLKQMALYDGNGTGTVTLSGAGAVPEIGVDVALSSVKAEPFFTDLAGVNRLSGVGNISLKLKGAGHSQSAIMRSLDGTMQLKLEDGAIKGADLAAVARTIQAVLSGAAIGSAAKTDFAELSASMVVANGVGRNDDLRLLNPFVRLSGAGTIDIANQRLDYRVEPRAVRSAEGQGGATDLRGVGIPFRIKGAWSKLSYSPDLTGIVNTTVDTILKGGDPLDALKSETGLDQIFGKKKPKPGQPAAPGQPATGQPAQPAPQPEPVPQPQPPPQPQPESPASGEPQPPDGAQPEQSVPPNTQGGTESHKTDPKHKVDPVDALKGLFGQ